MTTATKWALAAGVLALALIVALLPRVDDATDPSGARAADDLGAAREAAALQPCPSGSENAADSGELSGVTATCLADGSRVDVGAALSGEPTLVNFWATWCKPCRDELPLLAEYAEQPGAIRVLTVQVESSEREGLDLLAELGVELPGFHDGDGPTGPVRTALRVPRALPASYLVSADGDVRLVTEPRLFTSVQEIRDAVGGAA
ncbi:redoxin [Prauserella marina]|uniref:Thiol-disulfide isomerase or thioredoxin n=1 Tax=Prauserella marina TaxID=530584 RepID=A0A222VX58_9PSEU|nr:TlpA disulfide reductase family protein [Prauserella marina]ASR38402.1 redoxin [Prauserella marina]PWV78365.1 thiol-disulfide isomerase/thioredoxin [Prauserella marina]SDC84391.1 Thiol-disulfide isomerase or thioredoxin [Prauserella marina]